MATIVDPLASNAYKNAMIDAQIASETLPPKSDKKKRNEAQAN